MRSLQSGISREAHRRTRQKQSGTFNRLCSYKRSLALDFEECTSELPRDAFLASSNEAGMQVECKEFRERPTDARAENKVGPLIDFVVTSAVLLWISKSAHRSSHGMRSLQVVTKRECK
ncbi:hypothetical protein V1478_010097 [Vespula squamosa]|uniref:Uncharacterized protein n=1 Tax=Vespula squamosa TaxID=30214 RepID=A0ABD2AIS8_VESSQ